MISNAEFNAGDLDADFLVVGGGYTGGSSLILSVSSISAPLILHLSAPLSFVVYLRPFLIRHLSPPFSHSYLVGMSVARALKERHPDMKVLF